MNELLTYILKTAIIQCALLFCYRMLINGDTFYKMTRCYFGGGLLFSYIAPLIQFSFGILPPVRNDISQLSQLMQPATVQVIPDVAEIYRNQLPQTAVQWWQQYSFADILTAIFVAGTVIMLIRFAMQYISLSRLQAYQQHRYKTCRIFSIDGIIKPFSFGKRIYINPKLHTVRELDEIIRHELIHIRQHHSVDIIATAINSSIFWWNPFARLLGEDIRNNLEYIVDNEMLRNGINRKHYQYHLLNINQLNYKNSMANYFNFSNIKKRIEMMNKEKTQPVYKIKWLLLPLVAAVMLLSFNVKRAIATNVDFAVYSEITEPEQIAESDTPANGNPAANAEKTNGEIVAVKNTQTDADTITQARIFFDASKIAVRYDSTKSKQPLFIIDGKELNSAELSNLSSDVIETFYVIKGDSAIKTYGEKGKNGVAVIITKQNKEPVVTDPDCLVIIDGKESNKDELSKLSPNKIHSFIVMKDDAATKTYGEKGKNGVIIVETKQNKEPVVTDSARISHTFEPVKPQLTLSIQDSIQISYIYTFEQLSDKTSPDCLVIIDGKESNRDELSKLSPNKIHSFTVKTSPDCLVIIDGKESNRDELSKLSPNKIHSFTIIKDDTATKTYGEKGKNGVIIIETKQKL